MKICLLQQLSSYSLHFKVEPFSQVWFVRSNWTFIVPSLFPSASPTKKLYRIGNVTGRRICSLHLNCPPIALNIHSYLLQPAAGTESVRENPKSNRHRWIIQTIGTDDSTRSMGLVAGTNREANAKMMRFRPTTTTGATRTRTVSQFMLPAWRGGRSDLLYLRSYLQRTRWPEERAVTQIKATVLARWGAGEAEWFGNWNLAESQQHVVIFDQCRFTDSRLYTLQGSSTITAMICSSFGLASSDVDSALRRASPVAFPDVLFAAGLLVVVVMMMAMSHTPSDGSDDT